MIAAGRPGRGLAPEVSDLIGAELAIAVVIWLAVALICFFFVGAVAGIVAIFIGVVVAGLVLVGTIRRAEISD